MSGSKVAQSLASISNNASLSTRFNSVFHPRYPKKGVCRKSQDDKHKRYRKQGNIGNYVITNGHKITEGFQNTMGGSSQIDNISRGNLKSISIERWESNLKRYLAQTPRHQPHPASE